MFIFGWLSTVKSPELSTIHFLVSAAAVYEDTVQYKW